jgi:hypothetical protein
MRTSLIITRLAQELSRRIIRVILVFNWVQLASCLTETNDVMHTFALKRRYAYPIFINFLYVVSTYLWCATSHCNIMQSSICCFYCFTIKKFQFVVSIDI